MNNSIIVDPIPTLHAEHHLSSSAMLQDVVIGLSDGLTVPFALAAGLSGAVASSGLVISLRSTQANVLQRRSEMLFYFVSSTLQEVTMMTTTPTTKPTTTPTTRFAGQSRLLFAPQMRMTSCPGLRLLA